MDWIYKIAEVIVIHAGTNDKRIIMKIPLIRITVIVYDFLVFLNSKNVFNLPKTEYLGHVNENQLFVKMLHYFAVH